MIYVIEMLLSFPYFIIVASFVPWFSRTKSLFNKVSIVCLLRLALSVTVFVLV